MKLVGRLGGGVCLLHIWSIPSSATYGQLRQDTTDSGVSWPIHTAAP